jgi:hypothetical protein
MRRRLTILFAVGLVSLNLALWLAQGVFALPASLGSYFFGPKLVRAEVILKFNGVVHDYRVDRGKIRGISSASLTLLERDNTLVTLSVAPNVEVKLNGVPTSIGALRPRMTATAVREENGAVTSIIATRK